MSQDVRQTALHAQTKQLLQGPLKRVAAAGLAAALVPLAAVTAGAQETRSCPSGGAICGFVWQDTNPNGIREAGEPGIANAIVQLDADTPIQTDLNGFYSFPAAAGAYLVKVQIPPATQPSPADQGVDDTVDSDGTSDGQGNSVALVTLTDDEPFSLATDFGFTLAAVPPPGTGTPGYWKNHPDAWPVETIEVGGRTYTKAEAIAVIDQPGKDRTLTMFSSLLSAKLNVRIGNDESCVAGTIGSADAWMATWGPVGSSVHAASLAWKLGEPLHRQMDNYNNGMLCAPHRE